MQLQQLAYFVEVAHTLHFTRAAENMGVSQPTLSKQIRVLENSVGTRLFIDCIIADCPISPGFEEGLKVQAVLGAAMVSGENACWAEVEV